MNSFLSEYINLIGGKKKKSRESKSRESKSRELKRESYVRERYLESYDDYINNILPRALKINNKQWLIDIFINKTTKMLLHDDKDFILINDIQWNGKDIYELKILAFFKDPRLYSIRSLTGDHIKLLENVKEISCKIIKKTHNVDENQLKLFFHYRPTIWQLHLHFNSLFLKNTSSSIERAHSYYSIIENLKLDSDYYKKIKLHCFNDIKGEDSKL
jgi:m7GpppX diphosphatase